MAEMRPKPFWFRKRSWLLKDVEGKDHLLVFNKAVDSFRANFLFMREQFPKDTTKEVFKKMPQDGHNSY